MTRISLLLIIATLASASRSVRGSPSSITPPNAVSGGTLSCTVLAWMAFRRGKTAYQMA